MDGEEKKDASKEDLDQEEGKHMLYARYVCGCMCARTCIHIGTHVHLGP
jgi:hypothetical protein